MAVAGDGVQIRRVGARVPDDEPNVVDDSVHRHRELRHGRARGTADGPGRTQVRADPVRAADGRRMDRHTVRASSKCRVQYNTT